MLWSCWIRSTLGERERVRQLSEDSLTRYRRVLGDDHPDTLVAAHDHATHLRASGEYQQARALDEDTLGRRRRVLGEDHSDTLASAHNLAVDLGALGKYQWARILSEDNPECVGRVEEELRRAAGLRISGGGGDLFVVLDAAGGVPFVVVATVVVPVVSPSAGIVMLAHRTS
jgi:hypothetical protein